MTINKESQDISEQYININNSLIKIVKKTKKKVL